MKGGKKGRGPKTGSASKPKPAQTKRPGERPANAPPPKGSRKRPGYGGSSSKDED